jgi:glycosyltransferase involved in cell wall biosynthesis
MRVLYLTDRVSLRGGADRHLLQVVGWAAGAGHSVTVAAGRIERGATLPDGVRVIRARYLADRHRSGAGLAALESLAAKADLVHVQNVMNPLVLASVCASGGRTIVTVQDHRVFCPGLGKTIPDGSRCRRAMADEACAECLPDADYRARMLEITKARWEAIRGARLVVLSRYVAGELAAEGQPAARVIPPWVQVPELEPVPGGAFLFAGRLVTHKAPVDAWAAWRRADCGMDLRVAGAGPVADELVGAELLGWLAQADLARELHRSRALLFPSRWQEPFGMVGIEALSHGTPVIVCRSGGTGEWSDAGCLVVEPGDIDAMAEAISALAEDPAQATALGAMGREMVAERFSRRAIEDRLGALYASVAAGRPR